MSETLVPFSKVDHEKQLVYGEVYVPNVIDSQGEFMTAPNIELMAHRFMSEGRVSKVDTNHDLNDNGSIVVESFIARDGDPDFIFGSWVVGVHIPDADLWDQVKKGEINGYSMYGMAQREARLIEIELPDDGILIGHTYENDDHIHEFFVKFDEEGNILGGETNEVAGHKHSIKLGTATEESQDHRHRFSIMEAFQ
jgi:hypothetical protein